MNKLSIAIIAASLLVTSACSRVFIHAIVKSDKDLQLKQSNVVVVSNNKVSLTEFVKTFNKKYPAGQEVFVNEYVQAIARKLKTDGSFAGVKIDQSPKWHLFKNASFSVESAQTIDSLITNTQSDYLLRIHNFSIDNRIETRMMGGGPGMPMSNSSTEFCVVDVYFQLIDVKTKKIVLEFTATGEGAVIFFTFEKALSDAILASMNHAAEYLKSGRIEF